MVLLRLSGSFWHRRETVLRNARAYMYLLQRIPELIDADVADPDDLLDQVVDAETGKLATSSQTGAAPTGMATGMLSSIRARIPTRGRSRGPFPLNFS